jgi:hypothetical protein
MEHKKNYVKEYFQKYFSGPSPALRHPLPFASANGRGTRYALTYLARCEAMGEEGPTSEAMWEERARGDENKTWVHSVIS